MTASAVRLQRADDLLALALQTMVAAEGGQPHLLHYDSGRVNIGKGSWTGGHIVHLLDFYKIVAQELGRLDSLYGYFGGKREFDRVRQVFVRSGVSAVLSPQQEQSLKRVGRNRIADLAQDRYGAENMRDYLAQVPQLTPRYPWMVKGKISASVAIFLCHGAHQSGNVQTAWNMARGGLTVRDLKRRYPTERQFLAGGFGNNIAQNVQLKYRVGVRNRYRLLAKSYLSAELLEPKWDPAAIAAGTHPDSLSHIGSSQAASLVPALHMLFRAT